ncbi:PLP-dependent aminotransferase family protein [Micrococcales bacterium 31B]|nr:PLP-dependent aminotransferase family protein [Micrococcales bacterium 31B]
MNNDSTERLFRHLSDWLDAAAPGARLPSSRSLVAEFSASPLTVQRALDRLRAEGRIESRPGVGTFALATRRASASSDVAWQTAPLGTPRSTRTELSATLTEAPPEAIALHSGYPDRSLLPERTLRAAWARVGRTDASVVRPPAAGLPELRGFFAAELAERTAATSPAPGAADVIVTPGSQAGLSAIFHAVVGAGEPLLVESPTYWGAMRAADHAGVRLVPVPSGPRGPDPDAVEAALARTGARALYVQPTFANPTGACWDDAQRESVLRVARDRGAFVIEDDWARDFAMRPAPAPLACRDGDGHVIYLRSLTKSVSPAVRVAAVMARGPVRERILAQTQADSMYVSGALQQVALDVVSQPSWRAHVRRASAALQERRDALLVALREHAPGLEIERVPSGGLHLWARLRDGMDAQSVVAACRERGVLIAAGHEWFPAEPTGEYVRLVFAGPSPGRFIEAARALGEATQ